MPWESGKVTFKYTAFSLKDTFVVSSEDGSEVFVDTGPISGSGEATFCKPEGLRKVMVRVTGEDYNTVWNYNISCPVPPCDEECIDGFSTQYLEFPSGGPVDTIEGAIAYPVPTSKGGRVFVLAVFAGGGSAATSEYALTILADGREVFRWDFSNVTGVQGEICKPFGAALSYRVERRNFSPGVKTQFSLTAACPYGPCPRSDGPGSELTKLLGRFWIRYQPGCKCQDRAARMDDMGPEWCRENRELILSWMEEEARRRGIPYFRVAAELVLEAAISRAEARAASR
jgi:hypothetical protein